jgi:hypothetical protein
MNKWTEILIESTVSDDWRVRKKAIEILSTVLDVFSFGELSISGLHLIFFSL